MPSGSHVAAPLEPAGLAVDAGARLSRRMEMAISLRAARAAHGLFGEYAKASVDARAGMEAKLRAEILSARESESYHKEARAEARAETRVALTRWLDATGLVGAAAAAAEAADRAGKSAEAAARAANEATTLAREAESLRDRIDETLAQ